MYESPILTNVLGNKVMICSAAYIMPIYLLHDSLMEYVSSQGGGWLWCMLCALVVCIPCAIIVEFVLNRLQKEKV
jgi:peptidoglycan/LPS O-acetylase OafA/YrhL